MLKKWNVFDLSLFELWSSKFIIHSSLSRPEDFSTHFGWCGGQFYLPSFEPMAEWLQFFLFWVRYSVQFRKRLPSLLVLVWIWKSSLSWFRGKNKGIRISNSLTLNIWINGPMAQIKVGVMRPFIHTLWLLKFVEKYNNFWLQFHILSFDSQQP